MDMDSLFRDDNGLLVHHCVLQARRLNEQLEDVRHFRLLKSNALKRAGGFSAFDILDPNLDSATGPEKWQHLGDAHIFHVDIDWRRVLHTSRQRRRLTLGESPR